MGRQRTIRDQNFWRSPRLLNCTTEDKVALLHLLTAPDSNITGVYPLVPRIAGAELGWTADQWLQVIHRLQDEDLVRYDTNRRKSRGGDTAFFSAAVTPTGYPPHRAHYWVHER